MSNSSDSDQTVQVVRLHKGSETDSLKALDNGKDLVFDADSTGIINLKDSVNQGAGSLTFNSDYTVKSDNNKTWVGAGLIINDGVTVNWLVNGVKDDNLNQNELSSAYSRAPYSTESCGITGCISDGVLYVFMSKIVLQQARIHAIVSQRISTGMAQHMGMCTDGKSGQPAGFPDNGKEMLPAEGTAFAGKKQPVAINAMHERFSFLQPLFD